MLNLAKTMKEEANLEFPASLLTPNAVLAVVEVSHFCTDNIVIVMVKRQETSIHAGKKN